MKKTILILLLVAVIGGGAYWYKKHGGDAKDAAKSADAAAADEPAGTKVSRDDKGNVVVTMDDDTQGDNGINVAKPVAAQLEREAKGYGRVLDPAPLAALMTELATARAAYAASGNELTRLKTLEKEGNASTRALQTAAATALHDQLAVESAQERLALGWGKAIAKRTDLPTFLKSLAALETALVRVDLPGGEPALASPGDARLVLLSGNTVAAEYLDTASSVDPQTLGRGYIFMVRTNTSGLMPGEAITGFIKIPGDPLAGVIVPRDAVVRTEGSGWVYVLQGNAEDFVRVGIPLDRPVENGWFVTNGLTESNYVVVTGAQTLLSEELKGSAKPD